VYRHTAWLLLRRPEEADIRLAFVWGARLTSDQKWYRWRSDTVTDALGACATVPDADTVNSDLDQVTDTLGRHWADRLGLKPPPPYQG